MKKLGIIGLVFVAAMFALFVLGRVTGLILYYSVPTSSNIPNMKIGSRLWGTPLKTPEGLDFVAYLRKDPLTKQNEIWVHRVVAIGGDTVVIRNGLLYVNGSRIDRELNLNQTYIISGEELTKVKSVAKEDEVDVYPVADTLSIVFANEHLIAANKIEAKRMIEPVEEPDSMITARYHKQWNRDQFGPFLVPVDCYFVTGDNRHNALDSRYLGPVQKSELKGTIIR